MCHRSPRRQSVQPSPGGSKPAKLNQSKFQPERHTKLVPSTRAPILHPRITEHLLVAARAERAARWKGNTGGAVNTAVPVCQPGHAPSGLAASPLLGGDQLRLRPTSELSVFFGGACDPGQPSPVFEPCLAHCRTENTCFFVSKILLKITPSLESWSWTPPIPQPFPLALPSLHSCGSHEDWKTDVPWGSGYHSSFPPPTKKEIHIYFFLWAAGQQQASVRRKGEGKESTGWKTSPAPSPPSLSSCALFKHVFKHTSFGLVSWMAHLHV